MSDIDQTTDSAGRARSLERLLRAFHEDERGVAMTEYVMVFTMVTLGSSIALLSVTAYVKAFRDFLVWWLAHPAV